ncbi:Putative rhamnosyl transferase [Sulfitobacter brevis]|uniref:Putative rhamnosyl transferase n=1 Tax=Sulfitobacter brevis TaxID=74348 RepID=A0A1I2GGJ2_9RHOB|nr:glycosyltransferase [Sulfitobacter brevis]SFF15987.1 Putative rhamnosyl transferase [Sulfitobacter brevis]
MAQNFNLQIKGLVRFSYLSKGGFALSDKDPEAIREILYDPERLERRFALFERLALPSIRNQLDKNFTVGVLIGKSFPKEARQHLEAITANVPQVQIIALPEMVHYTAIKRAFAAMPDLPDATHTATFRLDDDDAMHRMTTRRVRQLANALLAIRGDKTAFALAFNRGFYLDVGNQEQPITEWYEKTPLGVGLALVAPKDDKVNVFRRNHRKLGEYFDCYTEVEKPMFIRSVHAGNDSGAAPTGRKGVLREKEIIRHLKRGFGMTLEDLRNV